MVVYIFSTKIISPLISGSILGTYLSFSTLPFASLLFLAMCKASSDNHFAFLHFFFLGDALDPCLLYSVRNFSP